MERDNLFLVPLDDRREWFRYHRLFADFLREELNRRHPGEVTALHRRASRWYLESDLSEQAFRHAVEGDDVDLVNQIFERYWPVKVLGGEIRVVQRWLDSLPTAWQLGYPGIGFARAGTLLITGQFEACTRYLDEVEQWLVPAERANMRGQRAKLSALRCFIACFQNDLAQAETLADRVLRGLPEEDHLRPGVYGALGDTYRRNGRWQEAQECYLQALDCDHAPTFQVQSAHIFGALADLDLRQGRLRNAAGYWREALAASQKRENWGRLLPLPVTGWMYIRLGELLYEWNELAESWDHVWRGLERAKLGGDVRAIIAGYLIAGRLKLTAGNIEAAAKYLERARVMPEFMVERVEPEQKVLVSYEEEAVPYDLLVTVPVNMGAEVVGRSGLGDELNHVSVDKHTFLSTRYDNIFALGDAASLPTSKAGSVAHFATEIFVENFIRYIDGLEMTAQFDGHANCYIESGFGKGILIDFNYEVEPLPGKFPLPGIGPFSLLQESELNHWGKLMFRWIYWG